LKMLKTLKPMNAMSGAAFMAGMAFGAGRMRTPFAAALGKRAGRAFASATLAMLVMAAPVFAAAEGSPSPADSTAGWIFRWVNFLIVAGLIVYLIRKIGTPQLKERAKEIGMEIQQAAESRDAAAHEREAAEKRLAGVQQEIAGLRDMAGHDEAQELERLEALIRTDVERIKHAATLEIAAAERTARLELKAAAARMAVARAEGMLREQMTREKQAGLLSTFVKQLFGWAR
jgi:F0F1-type ATP synthase membrane subunit b/b'